MRKKKKYPRPKPAPPQAPTSTGPIGFGQRVADKVAAFGGSWTFIFLFVLFMICWMIINSIQLISSAFDPYPYILLNLILSCLAALQAPVIMMSQNRQEQKDRLRAEEDLRINQKAELEIQSLHQKLDLLSREHRKLMSFLMKIAEEEKKENSAQ